MKNNMNSDFRKALKRVSFLLYAPLVLFFVFFAIIALVWNYEIEYLTAINTYMKNNGIVGFLQKYIMPAWKNQEMQLITKGYREIGILHNASTLFTLFYSFFVFLAVLLKFKMYYQDFLTVNVVKKKHAKILAYFAVPLVAIFLSLGSIMFLVPRKFVFINTQEGLTPNLVGLFENSFSIFLLLYATFIFITFIFPVNLKVCRRYSQNIEK